MKRIVSITLGLVVSLVIYLFYRTEKTVVNELVMTLLSDDIYFMIKSSIVNAVPLSNQIVFSLPGGLWVYCATALSYGFYVKVRNNKLSLSLFPIAFALGLEFCQLVHLTRGTFDYWDIGSYLLFWLIAGYSFRSSMIKENLLSPFTLRGFACLVCFIAVYLAHVNL